jgi:hypothetical protein
MIMSEYNNIFNKRPLLCHKNESKVFSITFNEVVKIKDKLIIPNIQSDLNKDKVNEMIDSYRLNPHHFCSRSQITIGHIIVGTSEKYYILDGQHRLEMAYALVNKGLNDTFLISLIQIKTKEELDKIFYEINKDSSKCLINNYEIFEKQIYEDLKKYFNENHNFLPKCTSKSHSIYSSSELADIIIKNNIINLLENKSSYEIYNFIKEKEKIFFNKIGYLEMYHNEKTIFKLSEIDSIELFSCIFMKNNNFINWLVDSNIKPLHNFTKKRQSIKKKLQNDVWIKEFGSKTSGNCPIYCCDKILSLDISNSWQCGHVISFNNGGSTTINNLRPICPPCNQSMSHNNWNDWVFEKMCQDAIDDYFEETTGTIKCKVKNCVNKINNETFKPFLYKNKKVKPICNNCYTSIDL